MIAIDSSVLLRYLLQDDKELASRANKLMLSGDDILITDIVLTSTILILTGKQYRVEKDQIVDMLYALFSESNLIFEDGYAVWGALKDYLNAKPSEQFSFADALVVNKANRYCQENNRHISALYTFDKAVLPIEGCKLA
jgi:predicted nucleic-acid-binding protein